MTTSFILLPDGIATTALSIRQWVTDLAIPKDLSRVLCYLDQVVPINSFYWTGMLIDCPPRLQTIDAGPLPWYMELFDDPIWATFISVLLISLLPLILLLPFLLGKKSISQYWIQVMLIFAAGGLVGDTLLHLLPEAYSTYEHGSNIKSHSHHIHSFIVGLAIFAGIFMFWCMDMMISHESSESFVSKDQTKKTKTESPDRATGKSATKRRSTRSRKNTNIENDKSKQHNRALLHLLADFLHNFTDGLALSAAWITSSSQRFHHLGLTTTMAILLHEIPHELGDIAVLMNIGGMSLPCAIWSQLITAIGALLGSVVGLWIGLSVDNHVSFFGLFDLEITHKVFEMILPFTAGTFLYLAMSMILPQLKNQNTQSQVGFVGCTFCFLCGFFLLSLC